MGIFSLFLAGWVGVEVPRAEAESMSAVQVSYECGNLKRKTVFQNEIRLTRQGFLVTEPGREEETTFLRYVLGKKEETDRWFFCQRPDKLLPSLRQKLYDETVTPEFMIDLPSAAQCRVIHEPFQFALGANEKQMTIMDVTTKVPKPKSKQRDRGRYGVIQSALGDLSPEGVRSLTLAYQSNGVPSVEGLCAEGGPLNIEVPYPVGTDNPSSPAGGATGK